MRQQLELAKLTIPKGESASEEVKLHQDTVVITIYSPPVLSGKVTVQLSADDKTYLTYMHKGVPVSLEANRATDIPVPACKSFRVAAVGPELAERVFTVLELEEL